MENTAATSLEQWQNNWYEANERNVALNKEIDRLRAELETANGELSAVRKACYEWKENAEEARRLLDEARGQEPVIECFSPSKLAWRECVRPDSCTNEKRNHYAAPVPAHPSAVPEAVAKFSPKQVAASIAAILSAADDEVKK